MSLSVLGFLTILISAGSLNEVAPNSNHAMAYSQDISFETSSAVHGITEDGCKFSSTGWQASDGVVVFLKIYYCKSPANAQRVLNKLTRKATKIFEKRTLTKGRKKTGERIVASFSEELIKRPDDSLD